MNCEELNAALHDYFMGTLAPEERRRVDAHLEGCAPCQGLVAICREITCREVADFLDDYVDDLLEPERRALFERHLAICPDCRNYLDSYRATIRLGAAALAGDGPPAELPEELIRAILAASASG